MLFTLMLACLTQPARSIGQDSKSQPSDETLRHSKPADFNKKIYYKNKLEFSLETGWLPINIPFVFDFLLGDAYDVTPLKYTLVPTIASLRWQTGNVKGPSDSARQLGSYVQRVSLRFRGDLKHTIGLTSWVFDVILSSLTGELRPTLTDASASGY